MKSLYTLSAFALVTAIILTVGPTWAGVKKTPQKLVTATDLLQQKGLSISRPSCAVAYPSPSGLVTATDLLHLKNLDKKKDNPAATTDRDEEDPWNINEDMGC